MLSTSVWGVLDRTILEQCPRKICNIGDKQKGNQIKKQHGRQKLKLAAVQDEEPALQIDLGGLHQTFFHSHQGFQQQIMLPKNIQLLATSISSQEFHWEKTLWFGKMLHAHKE